MFRINSLFTAGVSAIALLIGVGPAFAQAQDPSVKIGQGVQITPSAAMTYYGAAVTRTTSPASTNYPPEFLSLAKGLGSDDAVANPGGYADQVYDYVRNGIDIEPMFGSAKGLLGTIIDKNGTAFDQAELMVQLLRYGGIAADYQLVEVTHTETETANWLKFQNPDGTFNATALRQYLSDAGIPFNSVGTNITVLHPIVRASLSGTSYYFDPGYKPHRLIQGVALAAATGYSRTSFQSTAESTVVNGTVGGIPTVKAFNASGIDTQLNNLSGNLLNWTNSNKPVSMIEDLVGGYRILEATKPSGGWRQTSLSYIGTTWTTWTGASRIPDQFRTKLNFRLEGDTHDGLGGPNVHVVYFDGTNNFFTDEVYGRRFWIDTDPVLYNFNLSLKLDDTVIASATATQPGLSRPLHPLDRGGASATLTINHPYAASSGSYMDKVIGFGIDYFHPISLILGIGHTTNALSSRHGPEMYGQRQLTPISTANIFFPNGEESIAGDGPYYKSDSAKIRAADTWMEEASRMYDLQSRVSGGANIIHHHVGVSFGEYNLTVKRPTTPPTTNMFNPPSEDLAPGTEWTRLSIDSGLSLRSITADTMSENALRLSVAASSATLEGSVFEQLNDQVISASTASRYAWANNFGNSDACATELPQITCSTPVPLQFAKVDSTSTGTTWLKPSDSGFTDIRVEISNIPSCGPIVNLGPGVACYSTPATLTSPIRWTYNTGGYGGANISYNSNFTEIKHNITSNLHTYKGGGGAASPEANHDYDPKKVADILKDTFTDRSSEHGVSLANGQFSFSPGPDLVVGNPKGASALSFERYYSGGEGSTTGLPDGWTHNWDYSGEITSTGDEPMGSGQGRAASATLAAFIAMQDVLKSDPLNVKNHIEALLINDWWRRQLTFNATTIRRARSLEQFVRVPTASGDVWLAPKGSASNLLFTGSRSISNPSGTAKGFSQYWNYSSVGISWIGGDQSRLNLTLSARLKRFEDATIWNQQFSSLYKSPGSEAYYLPSTYVMANGQTLTFGYNSIAPNGIPASRLSTVSNSFGRTLTFNYAAPVVQGAIAPLISVTDNAGQTVSFIYGQVGPTGYGNLGVTLDTVNLPGGRTVRYEYVGNTTSWTGAPATMRIMNTPRMRHVFDSNAMALPIASRQPVIRLDYDSNWLVSNLYDAIAVTAPTTRNPFKMRVAPGRWGGRIDPLNGFYQVFYDQDGRAETFIDELGRTTTALYDSWGRVINRTLPEGNSNAFVYDIKSNVLSITQTPKPGSGLAIKTASATYDPLFNKPITVTDFNGKTTNLTYIQSGSGKGEILQALPPADLSGVHPQYDFTYTGLGLVNTITTKISATTSRVDQNTYDPVNGNLTVAAKDINGLNLSSGFVYDALGNAVQVDGPRSDVDDKTYTTFDTARRPVFEIGVDPDGVDVLKRTIVKHYYDQNGKETRTETGIGQATDGSDFIAKSYKMVVYDAAGNAVSTETGAVQ